MYFAEFSAVSRDTPATLLPVATFGAAVFLGLGRINIDDSFDFIVVILVLLSVSVYCTFRGLEQARSAAGRETVLRGAAARWELTADLLHKAEKDELERQKVLPAGGKVLPSKRIRTVKPPA